MTSDALAFVRAFFDLIAAEDYDRMPDSLDPDVVWFGTRGGLDQEQVFRGPDAVIDYLREIQEPWQQFAVEIERLVETGDSILVFMHETAQAKHGGLEVENNTAMTIKLRRQKIVEMRGYLDRDEALRAAGLPS